MSEKSAVSKSGVSKSGKSGKSVKSMKSSKSGRSGKSMRSQTREGKLKRPKSKLLEAYIITFPLSYLLVLIFLLQKNRNLH